ncbi:MAG: hypothetical protein AMXMBFR22_12700 [Phycisphaerae bacterium]
MTTRCKPRPDRGRRGPARCAQGSEINQNRRQGCGRGQRRGLCPSAAVVGMMLLSMAGCAWETRDPRRRDLGVAPKSAEGAGSASFRDTIGELATFHGLAPMKVQGYGLVIGLGDRGSTECPPQILNRLAQQIEKRYPLRSNRVGMVSLTPERLIRDPDTAVVLVEGMIPAAMTKGSTFDVYVSAVPNTGVKSLRGGRLYSCELEYAVQMSTPTERVNVLSGRSLAEAAGPLFLNPFVEEGEGGTQTDPTQAFVLGGGRVLEDRRLRLVLTEPSASTAMRIENRINAKFGGGGKIADALSPTFIQLSIPDIYRDEPGHFMLLVRHLFLPDHDGFVAQRCRDLAAELVQPDAPHAAISVAFEGVGLPAMPVLTELYAHKKDYVAFHAAAAGLRLGDDVAVTALARVAEDQTSLLRFQAIRALATNPKLRSPLAPLRKLLDDVDPRVRIEAYEALVKLEDPMIERNIVGDDNFILDCVPGAQSPIIYARRTQERRIALLGDNVECRSPIFYRAPDGALMINADAGAESLTLLRTVPHTGSTSPPVPASPEVARLVRMLGNDVQQVQGRVTGLGLDYTAIVHALHTLCAEHAINAQFIFEEENLAELFGPRERSGRPESEL